MKKHNKKKRPPFLFNGVKVEAGSQITIDLPAAQLYTHTPLNIPVQIFHGKKEGPCLLICAAIHGDELNGVEIIRRLLQTSAINKIKGTLIIVPVVNVFGFVHRSRYLPDRRDLNRCFPGSETGSLAARIAYRFRTQILEKATHVIDIHTGALYRSNFPQIRAHLDNPEVEKMAKNFGISIILNSPIRDGTLRGTAEEQGIPVLTYEGGEALRFDEFAIKVGLQGIINVMKGLSMISSKSHRSIIEPIIAKSSSWVRAEHDGILRSLIDLGDQIEKGQTLAIISSPLGEREFKVISPMNGIVIGQNNLPLVNEGEALFHIAHSEELEQTMKQLDKLKNSLLEEDPFLPSLSNDGV